MSNYRLIDVGFPYKKIMHGRKWVGRIVKCADGRYLARINNRVPPATEVYAGTEMDAFEEVVAKQVGFNNAAELHHHNEMVRMRNKAQRQRVASLAYRFQTGGLKEKIAVVDELLGIKK